MPFSGSHCQASQLGTDDSRKATINLFRELMAKAMPEFRRQTESQCMTNGNWCVSNRYDVDDYDFNE